MYEVVNRIGDCEMCMDYNELGSVGNIFWLYGYIDLLVRIMSNLVFGLLV